MHTTLPRRLLRGPASSTARSSSVSISTAGSAPAAPIRFRRPATTSRARSATRASSSRATRSGDIHALFNVCRHRGTRLCEQTEGHFVDRIQCPYHNWTYDLEGRLLAAPHMPPDFCKDDYPLHRAGCEVWDGNIFVFLVQPSQDLAHRLDLRRLPSARPARAICRALRRLAHGRRCVSAAASSTTSRRTGS